MSLRSSERGLKWDDKEPCTVDDVAPFVGAWIEILCEVGFIDTACVAPFVGAWIEIGMPVSATDSVKSLRSSERGLKYPSFNEFCEKLRRSVRRSVD